MKKHKIKPASDKLKQFFINELSYWEFIMIHREIEYSKFNILKSYLGQIVTFLQELQLIQWEKNFFVQTFFTYYHFDISFFQYEYILIYIGYFISGFQIGLLILILFFKKKSIELLKKLCQNSFYIYYYFFTIPFILCSIKFFIEYSNYYHLILMIMQFIINFLFIFFNSRISLKEHYTNFTQSKLEIIIYFLKILLCFLRVLQIIYIVQIWILIILSIIQIIYLICRTGCVYDFQQRLNIIKVTIAITSIFDSPILFFFLILMLNDKIIKSIMQRIFIQTLFQSNLNIKKLIQIQLTLSINNQQILLPIIERRINQIKQSQKKEIQYLNIKDQILVHNYLYNNSFQLHFFLLTMMKNKYLSIRDKIRINSNFIIIQNHYNSRKQLQTITTKSIVKIIEIEQTNLTILEQIKETKLKFFEYLTKNMEESQYFDLIKKESIKFCKTIQEFKKQLEVNIDFTKLTLKGFPFPDYITLQTIQVYYCIFYLNFQKAAEIQTRIRDLTSWNPRLNQKLKNNQIFLIKVSQLKYNGKILNVKSNGDNGPLKYFALTQIKELFPSMFQEDINTIVQDYITQNFIDISSITCYLQNKEFLTSCKLSFSYETQLDDLIIYYIIEIEDDSEFLLFDSKGKIIGLTKYLFNFLITFDDFESYNYNSTLYINNLGLIQNHIKDINIYIQQLVNGINNEPIQFQSQWLTNSSIQNSIVSKTQEYFPKDDSLNQKIPTMFSQTQTPNADFDINKMKFTQNLNQHQFQIDNQEFKETKMVIDCLLEVKQLNKSNEIYFILQFNNIQKEETEDQTPKEDIYYSRTKSSLNFNINFTNHIVEQIIQKKKISNSQKFSILIMVFLIIQTFITCIVNSTISKKEIMQYQTSVNFLINPQALTFSYAGSYLLMMNKYCVINGLYNLTPYIEAQRQAKLAYAFNLWKGIHINYTLNLSNKAEQLGLYNITLIDSNGNDSIKSQQVDYYSFYTITRERMLLTYKFLNYSNINTQDYSIFKGNGILRQNILPLFKYHDYVMNNEIDSIQIKINNSQMLFYIILGVETCCFFALTLILYKVLLIISFIQNKIFSTISFFDQIEIQSYIQQSASLKQITTNINSQIEQKLLNTERQLKERERFGKNNLISLNNRRYISTLKRGLIPLLFIIIYTAFLTGIIYFRIVNYEQYKQSLLMTLNYIKFKKLFDSSILLGELIKTEHLISGNPYDLINQTETTEYFFAYVDNSTKLFNTIQSDLIVSNYMNQTMKQIILQAFGSNLCEIFSRFLVFCNPSQIKLSYNQSDSYISLVQHGIGGIIQSYKQMIEQEFYYERSTLLYSWDLDHSKKYLNSQLHQNFFVQYAQDIQSCFFTCFSYFINETLLLSSSFINIIYNYYVCAGIIIIVFYVFMSIFWILYQYQQIHQMKYILTLLNPKMIEKQSIIRILIYILNNL